MTPAYSAKDVPFKAWLLKAPLKKLRKKLVMSQKEFADALGVSKQRVHNWEKIGEDGRPLNLPSPQVWDAIKKLKERKEKL